VWHTALQFASEWLASNCQLAAAAIVVCIAAQVLNKMSMMTTVCHACRVKAVGGGGVTGYSYIRGSHFFLNRGPAWSKFGPGCYYTHNYLIALCPGLPRWAGTRRNIHPLTLILVIRHALSTSSIYCDP